MKRVIKHGIRKEVKYYFICASCGCEFEMTNKDLMEEQQSIVFFSRSRCPDCNAIVTGIEGQEIE